MKSPEFDLARTLALSDQAPAPAAPHSPVRDGQVIDPAARIAAQALYQCFTINQARDAAQTWLNWAQAATPANRLTVYLIVWRHYLRVAKPAILSNNLRQKP